MTTVKIVKPDSVTPPVGDPPTTPTPDKKTRPLVPPKAPASSKWKNKVILSTLDGKIEWEKMNPEARKAFEQLFAEEKFLRQFGVTKEKRAFAPEQMKALYDGLSMAYQTIAGIFAKWPKEAVALLAYTSQDKEALAEPTADLVNRFAPSMVMDNKEVIVWLAVFGAVTQRRFLEARQKFEEIRKTQNPGRKPFEVPARANGAAENFPPPTPPSDSLDDLPPAPGVV